MQGPNTTQKWHQLPLLDTQKGFPITLPIGTNGKPLAAIAKFLNVIGKLMIDKTLATNGEEIINAVICNSVLAFYW